MGDSRFKVKYIGDYKASFIDGKTGLNSIIVLDKKRYTGMEKMVEKLKNWIDPIANYQFIDSIWRTSLCSGLFRNC